MRNRPIRVFILCRCTEQADFVDSHGEVAGERETVIGVYHFEKDAAAKKAKLEEDDKGRFESKYDYYRITSYIVI